MTENKKKQEQPELKPFNAIIPTSEINTLSSETFTPVVLYSQALVAVVHWKSRCAELEERIKELEAELKEVKERGRRGGVD